MGKPAHLRHHMGFHHGALGTQEPEVREEVVGRKWRKLRVEESGLLLDFLPLTTCDV